MSSNYFRLRPDLLDVSGRKVFISGDYHLFPDQKAPASLNALKSMMRQGDICVFVGDLFEVWYENSYNCVEGYGSVLETLRQFNDIGVELHLIVGNRDFMAFRQLQKRVEMCIHQESLLVFSKEERLILIHGDELLPDDIGYHRFKRFIRHPWVLACLRALPIFILKNLAGEARKRSREKVSTLDKNTFQPGLGHLTSSLDKYQVFHVIAGHLHRDLKLNFRKGQQDYDCTVLPDSNTESINYRVWEDGLLSDLKTV